MSRLAVCICTCDRAALLARVLGAIERIELGELRPGQLSLIVVDNRPDGRARGVCEQMASRLPMPLAFVEEATPGISFARNRAVAEAIARGADFAAFLDDDDEPRPDWLRQLVRTQRETGADLVFGFWQLPTDLALPGWLRDTRYFRRPRPEDRNRYGLPAWAGSYNMLASHRLLAQLTGSSGPFRPEFAHSGGEDTDLFIRATRAGFAHSCALDSIVVRRWQPDRLTLAGVLRRGFVHGGSRIHLARAHLPSEQLSGLVWSSWRKLGKSLLGLPLVAAGRGRLADALLATTQAMGELHAWAGLRRHSYLGRRG
jgi:succinoglycan biosynthesis protein ExoM